MPLINDDDMWGDRWSPREMDEAFVLDERRLVRGLKKGEESAFNLLVLRYQTRIYNICYRMVGDSGDAEDLAQETFIRAFRGIRTYQRATGLSTWLYRISTNLCKNYIAYRMRRHRNIKAPVEDVPERAWRHTSRPLTGAPAPQPDEQYERSQAQSHIQRALASLSPEAREVLILRDIEGLTYQEIAEVTQTPLGTIKSKLWRARVAFKTAYRKSGGTPL